MTTRRFLERSVANSIASIARDAFVNDEPAYMARSAKSSQHSGFNNLLFASARFEMALFFQEVTTLSALGGVGGYARKAWSRSLTNLADRNSTICQPLSNLWVYQSCGYDGSVRDSLHQRGC